MILRIIIIYAIASTISCAVILYLMWKAPRGHQNENGFYYEDDKDDKEKTDD